MKSISFLVCPNGFGHLKRVLKISSVLINNDVKLNVLCNKKAINHLSFFADDVLLNNKKINFLEINFPAYGTWTTDLTKYDFYEYKSWIDNLDKTYLEKSSLFVSDNFAGVLARRTDAILEGSFLWSDVMSDSSGKTNDLRKIIDFENDLLRKTRPVMICNKDFVMPAIIELTDYKKFGWTCENIQLNGNTVQKRFDEIKILVTGGGTGAIDENFENIFFELSKLMNVTVYTDSKLFDLYSKKANNILKFSFSDEEFKSLSFMVCRPGIGILTDSVKYGIPIVPLYEDNKEMKFNYERVLELNLGMSFDALLNFLYDKNIAMYKSFFNNLVRLEKNGHIKISEYLINKLNN